MKYLYYKTEIEKTKICVIANNGSITMSINEKFESTQDIDLINKNNVCDYLSGVYWKYMRENETIADIISKLANNLIDKFNQK